MKYKYIDTYGRVIENLDEIILRNELKKSFKEWQKGSGDAAVESSTIDLIIIKVEPGIFILQLADYTSPHIHSNEETKVLTHHVGGEPMKIPSNCLCDEETAVQIIKFFIENDGQLNPKYHWIDINDLIHEDFE